VNAQSTRRPPFWIADYTSGEEILDDDNIAAHCAFFAGKYIFTINMQIRMIYANENQIP